MTRTRALTLAAIAACVACVAWFAWSVYARRWISDDGLIDVRVVREILAGNGPVYNAFERTEPNTSALWTWLLALVGAIARGDLARDAVVLGGVLSVAALIVALAGAHAWHRSRGATAPMVPFGALVVCAVLPFRDFATSGLEGSLGLAWIAAAYRMLVAARPESSRRFQLGLAVVIGLGPLVRPDFALVSLAFGGAAVAILRPARRHLLALGGAAIALPLAYEIFRAGYYGTLVPLPAISKSASGSNWARGWRYAVNYAKPYAVWFPLAIAAALGVATAARRVLVTTRDRALVIAPVAAGVLAALYVVRVGGDFMHGRMLLPPTFLVLLPVMMLPVTRSLAPAIAAMAIWAIAIANHNVGKLGVNGSIDDERKGYVAWTETKHPDSSDDFVHAERSVLPAIRAALSHHRRRVLSEGGFDVPMSRDLEAPLVFAVGRLGVGALVLPDDAIVADTLGLANPIGARITVTNPGFPGHEKVLSWSWLLAEFEDPKGSPVGGATSAEIAAARHALSCGDLAELLASTREPMSLGRFWANVTGSLARTRLVIPADPFEAEKKFCGQAQLTAASSFSNSAAGGSGSGKLP